MCPLLGGLRQGGVLRYRHPIIRLLLVLRLQDGEGPNRLLVIEADDHPVRRRDVELKEMGVNVRLIGMDRTVVILHLAFVDHVDAVIDVGANLRFFLFQNEK